MALRDVVLEFLLGARCEGATGARRWVHEGVVGLEVGVGAEAEAKGLLGGRVFREGARAEGAKVAFCTVTAAFVEFQGVSRVKALGTWNAVFGGFMARKCVTAFVRSALVLVERRMLAEGLAAAVYAAAILLTAFMEGEVALEALCCCKALVAVFKGADVVSLVSMSRKHMALQMAVTEKILATFGHVALEDTVISM